MNAQPPPFAPTRDADLNGVLDALVTRSQAILSDNFVGAYLHGSIGLGAWDVHSDVDFLIVVAREVSEAELADLQVMHGQLYDLPSQWAQHLEGSYFPAALLRQANPTRTQLPFLNNGSRSLEPSVHDDNYVGRWLVRECGIVLAGPDPKTLIDPIPTEGLRREIWDKLQAWAAEYAADPAMLNNRWDQPYAVLSFCRMLYTLETATVGSKPASAEWAKRALDPQWTDLIERSWEDRPDPSLKIRQPADPDAIERTLEFIRYAHAVGGQFMAGSV